MRWPVVLASFAKPLRPSRTDLLVVEIAGVSKMVAAPNTVATAERIADLVQRREVATDTQTADPN